MDFNAIAKSPTKQRGGRQQSRREMPAAAPLFLRKTYEMINTCDPEIANWSEDGLTFVVKDTKKFQYEFIPKYFKHNNFSSFVRQLNFYGFRKIRSDPVLLSDADTSDESKYWRFHHDSFRRGRPDLLSSIRKSTHNESAGKQEVDALRNDVATLKRDLYDMTEDVEDLKANVGELIQKQQAAEFRAYSEIACNKKRKFHQEAPASVSSNAAVHNIAPYPTQVVSSNNTNVLHDFAPNPVVSNEMVNNLTADPTPLTEVDILKDIKPLPNNAGRNESTGAASFTSQEEAMLTSLIALDPLDEIEVLESDASQQAVATTTTPTTTPSVMSHNNEGD